VDARHKAGHDGLNLILSLHEKKCCGSSRPPVESGRITGILNGRRSITADTAVRLGCYFGNSAQFWLDLQGQFDIATVEREKGAEITRRVRPADAA
jgi:hypothetical protein